MRAMRYSIGIVVAARNAERFLPELLESIRIQELPPQQVVVVNDGSTDKTENILNEWSRKITGLTVLKTEAKGISAARNLGNRTCLTDYIAVIDADDLLSPDAIKNYDQFIHHQPKADLIYADCIYFVQGRSYQMRMAYPSFETRVRFSRVILGGVRVPFKHSSILYRKQAIEELGGYDERLPAKVDIDLVLKFLVNEKKVYHLKKVVSWHRKHLSQISARNRIRGIRIFYQLIDRYESKAFWRGVLKSSRTISECLKAILRG